MYKLHEKKKLNIAAEIRAMTAFVTERWNSVENVEQLFQQIADKARKMVGVGVNARTADYRLNQHAMERRAVVEAFSDNTDVLFYDQPYIFFKSMAGAVYKLNLKSSRFKDFEDTLEGFKENLPFTLAHLKRAEPKRLRSMVKHYENGTDTWDKAVEDEGTDRDYFLGADTENGTSGGFAQYASLIFVTQQKSSHRKVPAALLIEGAYRHFLDLYTHINTEALFEDVKGFLPVISEEMPVFDLTFTAKHRVTKLLEALAREEWLGEEADDAEKAYLANLEKIREENAQSSKDEIAAIQKSEEESRAEIAAIWQSIVNKGKVGTKRSTARRAKR